MKTYRTVVAVVIAALLFLVLPARTEAKAFGDTYEEKVMLITGDLLILRPVGVAALVGGSALFVLAAPFAALTGNTKETARTLVKTPFDFTFRRPLGTKIEQE